MNKISDANVRRLLNRLFLKAGFEVCLFARVGNHRPCLRLHLSLPPLMAVPRDIHVLSCESAESCNHSSSPLGRRFDSDRSDLLPCSRTKLSMICAKERGRGYVEEQAHGSADERGAEATGGWARGGGCGDVAPSQGVLFCANLLRKVCNSDQPGRLLVAYR
jgi:hypothetical protein